jgi:hypothetical protein
MEWWKWICVTIISVSAIIGFYGVFWTGNLSNIQFHMDNNTKDSLKEMSEGFKINQTTYNTYYTNCTSQPKFGKYDFSFMACHTNDTNYIESCIGIPVYEEVK